MKGVIIGAIEVAIELFVGEAVVVISSHLEKYSLRKMQVHPVGHTVGPL